MTRKKLAVILCLAVSLAFAGCSGEESADSSSVSQSQEEISASSADESERADEDSVEDLMDVPVAEGEFTLADCIDLGEYRGITLSKAAVEVTDEDVDSYIKTFMEQEAVTDPEAAVQEGDTVNIAFEGTRDGEAFEGGSSDSYDLVIGSGRMIPGFEEGIVGMKLGETRDLELTFPEDYDEESLRGVDAEFSVTVNSIRRAPDITDAWVAEYTEGSYATADEYRTYVRELLTLNQENSAIYTMRQDAWSQILANSTFKQFPKSYVDEGADEFDAGVEYEASVYGMDKDPYIELAGLSEEDYAERREQYGRSVAQSRLLLEALSEKEGITTDSPEYLTEVENMAAVYEMDTETLISTYGEDMVEQYAMTQAVLNRVMEAAQITEKSADSAEK